MKFNEFKEVLKKLQREFGKNLIARTYCGRISVTAVEDCLAQQVSAPIDELDTDVTVELKVSDLVLLKIGSIQNITLAKQGCEFIGSRYSKTFKTIENVDLEEHPIFTTKLLPSSRIGNCNAFEFGDLYKFTSKSRKSLSHILISKKIDKIIATDGYILKSINLNGIMDEEVMVPAHLSQFLTGNAIIYRYKESNKTITTIVGSTVEIAYEQAVGIFYPDVSNIFRQFEASTYISKINIKPLVKTFKSWWKDRNKDRPLFAIEPHPIFDAMKLSMFSWDSSIKNREISMKGLVLSQSQKIFNMNHLKPILDSITMNYVTLKTGGNKISSVMIDEGDVQFIIQPMNLKSDLEFL